MGGNGGAHGKQRCRTRHDGAKDDHRSSRHRLDIWSPQLRVTGGYSNKDDRRVLLNAVKVRGRSDQSWIAVLPGERD